MIAPWLEGGIRLGPGVDVDWDFGVVSGRGGEEGEVNPFPGNFHRMGKPELSVLGSEYKSV